ncbi:FAD-binding oxidoreductase [Clostridium paraputrificum]|uniref:FAD-binding oxidoreductase n=1 Tax=Clostridium TaxID=1485 RepID=UPI003D33CB86
MMNFNFNNLTGEVITRDSFQYEESRKAWNRAIEKYPLVIVYCHNNEDVINALIWAKENSLPIRIRSGCHHYEGYSTGNDLVVIDVSKMNNIYVDEENGLVKIEGGVRNRELYEAMGSRKYPFPGGGCPTVGVVGLTLGGGWGYSSRFLGLASDSLVELELVDYKGNIIIANERKNEDLFWACRGAGGGNFGVIVSMTFKIPSKAENATLINIDCNEIDIEEKIELVQVWQREFKNLDRRMNMKMGIYNSKEKGKGIKMAGLFYGDNYEAKKLLEPFKNAVSKIDISLEYMSVLEANRAIQDSHPDYEKYKSSGRFVYRDYSREEIEQIINLVDNRAEGAVYTAISFYGLGGAVSDQDNSAMAVSFRDARFIMALQSVWEDSKYSQINSKWMLEKFKYIKKVTDGSFINFPLAELDNYEEEYYKDIGRLREIKSKYDPENIFDFPQGIKRA